MDKKIDAVGMMRKIRDELSSRYHKSPQAEKEDLEKIRKKYSFNKQVKQR